MPEYPPIQLVDDDDRPIGGSGLDPILEKGLKHRVVHVFVVDENGRHLLQMRGSNVATNPNTWDFATAGYVDEGEDYDVSAIRELKEELGLVDSKLEKVDKYYIEEMHGDYKTNRFVGVFKAVINSSTKITPEPEEVDAVKWFTKEEVNTLIASQPDQVSSELARTFSIYF